MNVTDPKAITTQVYQLETIAHGLAEAYRKDLETSFGEGIRVGEFTRYDWAAKPEEHFYDIYDSKEIRVGIVLPIPKKAVIRDLYFWEKDIEKVEEILEKRGYEIFRGKGGAAYHDLRVLGIGE